MFDFIMTDEQKKLRDEARAFTKWVPKEMILAMDDESLQFPHEYLKEAGKINLLGLRIPKELGGRGLGWLDDAIAAEEIGVASYSTNEIMQLIIQGEWYREYKKEQKAGKHRDVEADALNAHLDDEKIYE